MDSDATPMAPNGGAKSFDAALQHRLWRNRERLSRCLEEIENFLGRSRFEQGPWAVVLWAAGIAAWFAGTNQESWLATMTLGAATATGALAVFDGQGRFTHLRRALVVAGLALGLGCGFVWCKSVLAGAAPIARPLVATIDAEIRAREERPSEGRVRLMLATRDPETGRAILVRVNLDQEQAGDALREGARVRLRARLVPPAPPMLPGGYDFARSAWFSGVSASGTVLGPVDVMKPGEGGMGLAQVQRDLSRHVRGQLGGSAGAIAAAFASGDRGAIAPEDEDAMRDAGLTHLLSISGLHVSAVIAGAYFLALRILALFPWLALRVRLPLLAAACGALAGIGYTVLTGAQVPTIRSCIGAVLVMLALALGREPLSMRMIAVAAFLVLLLWPEALVGPSFQMSFAAVIAIVALHGSDPVRRFTSPREEPRWMRGGRQLGMLLVTGVVIELALMPIGLFHFHRSGVYGALANVVAIPLTTLISMPLIAAALAFDSIGWGAPFWWMAGKSLDLLLMLAHWTASLPGAVTVWPAMGQGAFCLFVLGGLWLALWRGKVRLWGLAPTAIGAALLAMAPVPDLLVSGDGNHIGIPSDDGRRLLVLRETRSEFARDSLIEAAGMAGELQALDHWPGARCNRDFCSTVLQRGDRRWLLLLARNSYFVPERELAAACERVDIVVGPRYLPRSCQPRWVRIDRRLLAQTGGLAIDLENRRITTVAQGQGAHAWWRAQQASNALPTGGRSADQQAPGTSKGRPARPVGGDPPNQ